MKLTLILSTEMVDIIKSTGAPIEHSFVDQVNVSILDEPLAIGGLSPQWEQWFRKLANDLETL